MFIESAGLFLGQTMEALQYSNQLVKRPEELTNLMWALVAKDRENRYPELFNPIVWQQLELRLARVLSRSEDHLSQMFVTSSISCLLKFSLSLSF